MTGDGGVREVDVLVVGAGPAGLCAAAALARAGCGTVEVLEREQAAGGIPRHSDHLGYGVRDLHRVVSGPAYAQRLVVSAVEAGALVRVGVSVTGWDLSGAGPPALATTSRTGLETVRARAVVLATGARERPRAARLVPGVRAAGVYTTGELQQAVHTYRQRIGTRAVIVGAEHVSFSAAVTLRHAGVQVAAMVTDRPRHQSYQAFRAGAALVYRFPVLTGAQVLRLVGGRHRLEGVEVARADGTLETIAADTVVFTGDWIADNELARTAGMVMDGASTGPLVDTGLRTSRRGVYAAGNLAHPVLTADCAALAGRFVASSVLADLRQQGTGGEPAGWPLGFTEAVRVVVAAPLRWIVPGRVVDPGTPPPRGRFVLWADDFVKAPRVQVRQGDRLLHTSKGLRPLVPGRPFEIGAGWLPRVVVDGPEVSVSLQ